MFQFKWKNIFLNVSNLIFAVKNIQSDPCFFYKIYKALAFFQICTLEERSGCGGREMIQPCFDAPSS